MSYKKFVVDNVTCQRRFHLSCDDDDPNVESQKIDCPFCGVEIFAAKDHPRVKLLRQENLIQTQELSENLVKGCDFRDTFSEDTIPEYKGQDRYLYKS